MLVCSSEDFKKHKNMDIMDNINIWKKAYVVATSDRYLHVLNGPIHEVPDKSFNLAVRNSYTDKMLYNHIT